MHMNFQRQAGFSMVEVALAVLILGIGVLTVVGLMGGGLQMGKDSEDETREAMFANDVMDGTRSLAGDPNIASNVTALAQYMDQALASPGLEPVAKSLWDPKTTGGEKVKKSQSSTDYKTFHYIYSSATNLDLTCRYRLQVNPTPYFPTISTKNIRDRTARIRLDVVSGLYGQGSTNTFYTEVYQFAK